jgi:hypothetical protein
VHVTEGLIKSFQLYSIVAFMTPAPRSYLTQMLLRQLSDVNFTQSGADLLQ